MRALIIHELETSHINVERMLTFVRSNVHKRHGMLTVREKSILNSLGGTVGPVRHEKFWMTIREELGLQEEMNFMDANDFNYNGLTPQARDNFEFWVLIRAALDLQVQV